MYYSVKRITIKEDKIYVVSALNYQHPMVYTKWEFDQPGYNGFEEKLKGLFINILNDTLRLENTKANGCYIYAIQKATTGENKGVYDEYLARENDYGYGCEQVKKEMREKIFRLFKKYYDEFNDQKNNGIYVVQINKENQYLEKKCKNYLAYTDNINLAKKYKSKLEAQMVAERIVKDFKTSNTKAVEFKREEE